MPRLGVTHWSKAASMKRMFAKGHARTTKNSNSKALVLVLSLFNLKRGKQEDSGECWLFWALIYDQNSPLPYPLLLLKSLEPSILSHIPLYSSYLRACIIARIQSIWGGTSCISARCALGSCQPSMPLLALSQALPVLKGD